VWSRDGKQIWFYSDRNGSYEIWSVRPDGTGLTQITDTPGEFATGPRFSPDGKKAIYALSKGTEVRYESLELERPLRGQQAGKLKIETEGKLQFNGMDFSPDGRRLIGTLGDNSKPRGLAIFDLEAQKLGPLMDFGGGAVGGAVFVNDRFALVAHEERLYRLDTQTGTHEVIFTAEAPIDSLALSPDKRILSFTQLSTEADIWMLSRDD
jgi:Tol biopolymer transport system component